jgi:ferredoxin-NADP reductase
VAGAAVLERLTVARAPVVWRLARVRAIEEAAEDAVTIELDLDDWPGHAAGQHLDVRLSAEDGYQAQRSYSIASGPEDPRLELTVERIDDGEVSPYLAGVVQAGDEFEVRGPVGGHFTWRATDGGPL